MHVLCLIATFSLSSENLKLLLGNLRPVRVRRHMCRPFEGANSGESKFARITRKSNATVIEALRLLWNWNDLFPDFVDPKENLLSALRSSFNLDSDYGSMNTDLTYYCLSEPARRSGGPSCHEQRWLQYHGALHQDSRFGLKSIYRITVQLVWLSSNPLSSSIPDEESALLRKPLRCLRSAPMA
jgi:hypothetical protein